MYFIVKLSILSYFLFCSIIAQAQTSEKIKTRLAELDQAVTVKYFNKRNEAVESFRKWIQTEKDAIKGKRTKAQDEYLGELILMSIDFGPLKPTKNTPEDCKNIENEIMRMQPAQTGYKLSWSAKKALDTLQLVCAK
ncbi:MAG: hypothetical protein AB7O96_10760 [Pseudobdellovibrionaceae bacterium]